MNPRKSKNPKSLTLYITSKEKHNPNYKKNKNPKRISSSYLYWTALRKQTKPKLKSLKAQFNIPASENNKKDWGFTRFTEETLSFLPKQKQKKLDKTKNENHKPLKTRLAAEKATRKSKEIENSSINSSLTIHNEIQKEKLRL